MDEGRRGRCGMGGAVESGKAESENGRGREGVSGMGMHVGWEGAG